MIASLTRYEEMNPREIAVHWTGVDIKAPGGLSVYKSPNKALWAFVDERRGVTVVMWNVHTGRVLKEEKPILGSDKLSPEDRDPTAPDKSVQRTLLEDREPKPSVGETFKQLLAGVKASGLPRGKCCTCPEKVEQPKDGYPWTCRLRGFGVGPEYGGCTRELGLKKKEAEQ